MKGTFLFSAYEREETTTLNTAINSEVYEKFKAYCKRYGYPMNVIIELFMDKFIDGEIMIDIDETIELSKNVREKSTFSTSINAELSRNYKTYCKANGYKMNGAITVFMDRFSDGKFAIELVELE